MRQDVLEQMYAIIDEHIDVEELNALLKIFIQEKEKENSVWSSMTEYTHLMLGGTSEQLVRAAAATELVILSLDIVDDLQDRDQESKPWMQCAESYTLNAILALLMGFTGELEKLQARHGQVTPGGQPALDGNPKLEIQQEISRIVSRSINGQHKDINQSVVTADDYFAMVQEKSGSLIRLACCMGCFSTEYTQETLEKLHALADYIGLIHQIQNDIKDMLNFDQKSDLIHKKRTLPVIYILESQTPYQPIKDYYEGTIQLEEFLTKKQACLQYIEDSGCIEYSKIVQSICITKAEEIYETLEAISPWKEKFREATYGGFV
ncbi:polyprenyl synthetase family protein [Paenibacillus eucommiae]|uniref:Competence protein ComQ n=1 Tax=Paenibacillus eucommiae TaxID=1355755 RepID=A0ABS4IZ99_9BACL|nr:polyprenyl synthetase family protein [Paenibacillus eucommiae]MBP1992918.1 competence protein ComQ [Paenibacillus eucommiae]